MNDPKYDAPDSQFSLNKELRKRKTQQVMQSIENNRTRQAWVDTPAPEPPKVIAADFSRARRVEPSVASVPNNKRRLLVAGLIGSVLILVGVLVLSRMSANTAQPPLKVVPQYSAQDTVTQLKTAGLPVASADTFQDQAMNWHAKEPLQVKLQHGNDKGTFLLLSYDSGDSAARDAFRAGLDNKYKQWTPVKAGNVLVLISPTTAPALRTEIQNGIIQLLIEPYRDGYVTATPAVTK